MLMDDNDINENEPSPNVSIHSIVSDQASFDSDIEAPQDSVGQQDKIILNHVVKTIVKPGIGVDKPSKHDYITINYKCYFKDIDNNINIIDNITVSDYLYRIILPYGIVKAIKYMREKEIAKITLEPKYGFRKVEFNKMQRYINIDIVNKHYISDINALYNKLKDNTLIYEIELIKYIKIYDLTGNRNMMKHIIKESVINDKEDVFDNNIVRVNIKLLLNGDIIIDSNTIEYELSLNNFSYAEIVIIKSMKKEETCRVDIQRNYFKENYNQNTIIGNIIKEKNISLDYIISNRIEYEVTLISFDNSVSTIYYKEQQITKKEIQKGIGNISPWKDAIIMAMVYIKINNNQVYTNLPCEYNIDKFIETVKNMKDKITTLPDYKEEIQFKVDDILKELKLEFPIYNHLEMNFPNFFRSRILQSMKVLSVVKVDFIITNNNYEDNYMLFKGFDICDYINKDIDNNIELIVCLLNFEEEIFVLNNKLLENKAEKLMLYKEIANNFYKRGLLHRAKKINKKLVDMYIKYINLGKVNEITLNKENEGVYDITTSTSYDKELDSILKKVFSNLIIILYKMNRIIQCEEYIKLYLNYYIVDEKVMFYKYKILLNKGDYDNASTIIKKLIEYLEQNNILNNIELYKKDYDYVIHKIEQGKINNKNLIKKMMKYNK